MEVINVKALDEKYKLEPEITPEEIDQIEYDEFIGVGKYFMTKGKKQVPDKLSLPEELRPVLFKIHQGQTDRWVLGPTGSGPWIPDHELLFRE